MYLNHKVYSFRYSTFSSDQLVETVHDSSDRFPIYPFSNKLLDDLLSAKRIGVLTPEVNKLLWDFRRQQNKLA